MFSFAARSVIDDQVFVNGDNDDRIAGGEETTIEKHPHQLSLRVAGNHVCGASLISPIRALSAARCVGGAPPTLCTILAGSTTRSGDANAQIRSLYRFVVHEKWNPNLSDNDNDITILFWQKPLTLGARVRPIRLPVANAAVPEGESTTTSGWGYDGTGRTIDILKVVTQPLLSDQSCNHTYDGEITPSMICSGGLKGRGGKSIANRHYEISRYLVAQKNNSDSFQFRISACYGDTGGPLVHDNTLIGISSWMEYCGRYRRYPNVYARVAFFVDWINKNIK